MAHMTDKVNCTDPACLKSRLCNYLSCIEWATVRLPCSCPYCGHLTVFNGCAYHAKDAWLNADVFCVGCDAAVEKGEPVPL